MVEVRLGSYHVSIYLAPITTRYLWPPSRCRVRLTGGTRGRNAVSVHDCRLVTLRRAYRRYEDPASHFMPCSGCQVARYCSIACQHAAWEAHETECGRLKAEREEGTRIVIV